MTDAAQVEEAVTEEAVTEEAVTEEAAAPSKPSGELLDRDGEVISVEDAIKKADGKEEKADDGERPKWLPEKFKSAEDMAKSYSELEKTLKEKGKVAPDKYEFEETYGLEEDIVTHYSDFAKEAGLTNGQADAVLKYAQDAGYFDVPVYDEELKKMGEDGEKMLSSLESYAATKLLPAEREALEGMVYTAEQAKLLYKIIRASDKQIPSKPGEGVGSESKKDFQGKLNTLLSEPDIKSNREKQQEAMALANKIATM